jgi:hypothetical protein
MGGRCGFMLGGQNADIPPAVRIIIRRKTGMTLIQQTRRKFEQ